MDYRDALSANTTDADWAMIEDQPRGLLWTGDRPDNGEPPKGPDGISAMPLYTVMVDDNFHYMDEDERWQLGTFATAEEAVAACQKLVDDSLLEGYRSGMTAKELYDYYTSFGDDPFVIAPAGAGAVGFSAWTYARTRADELCQDAARIPAGGTDGHT